MTKKENKEATILKMDMFDKGMGQRINDASLGEMFSLAKICSQETVLVFAEKLVAHHRPIVFDFAAKFGIAIKVPEEQPACEKCRVFVEPKVVSYCRAHEKRFEGVILCRTCQNTPAGAAPVPEPPNVVSGPTCQECSTQVDQKVVAFCRFNSRRFGRRVLCRSCQTNVVVTVG